MRIKRVLSLVLAMCMMFAMLTGCNKVLSDEEQVLSDEDQIKEVIVGYGEAVSTFDFNKALEYISKDAELYQNIAMYKDSMTIDTIIAYMIPTMNIPDEYEYDVSAIIKEAFNNMLSQMEVRVDSVSIDGDKATASAVLLMPDTSSLDISALEDFDLAEFYSEEEIAEIEEKSNTLTGDELEQYQKEIMLDFLEKAITKAINDLEIVEQESAFELEKIDDEWLIVAND